MKLRAPYKGYVLEADPVPADSVSTADARPAAGRWTARVVIELHEGDDVHFQEVLGDPTVTYGSDDEAARASLELGRQLLDSRPHPLPGESRAS